MVYALCTRVGNCSQVTVQGINVTIPSTSTPGHILSDVGCRPGYELSNGSFVRDVRCQLTGTWTDFPICESKYFLQYLLEHCMNFHILSSQRMCDIFLSGLRNQIIVLDVKSFHAVSLYVPVSKFTD